ncbi:MAG: putative sporulation protein YtxC [Bacillota bacterium]
MQAITIGTAAGIDEIRQRLDDEFRFLQEEGVRVRIGQSHRGRFAFLDCSLDDGVTDESSQMDALVRHYVASALSDVIVERWENDLIRKIIRGSYSYFSRDEQDLIADYTGRTLNGAGGDSHHWHKVNRKSQILHRLRDYLDSADELVVEGFVTFRLRDYVEELEDAVDRAVDEFLMEREYKEFIRLLQYFVDVQEPRIDHVHVLLRPGGSFKLVDDDGGAIKSEALEEFVVEMVDSEVNYEDLLISALITLAPRSLTVHVQNRSDDRDEALETITGVFGERAVVCDGCSFCAAIQSHQGDSSQATLRH